MKKFSNSIDDIFSNTYTNSVLIEPEEARTKYIRWARAMDKYNYTWQAYELTTEDGYILTTFHVTGIDENGPITSDKGTVLI